MSNVTRTWNSDRRYNYTENLLLVTWQKIVHSKCTDRSQNEALTWSCKWKGLHRYNCETLLHITWKDMNSNVWHTNFTSSLWTFQIWRNLICFSEQGRHSIPKCPWKRNGIVHHLIYSTDSDDELASLLSQFWD